MSEKKNAKQFPKIYYARHMQPGICGYENERVLVDTNAIKGMLPSAVGKPVYVHHDEGSEADRLKNMQEDACGYITEAFYNETDGWAWFKIIITTDEGHAAVAKGWKVSNAYVPSQWGLGGTKNNVPFDREILGGEFTHLAVVPNPRYEDALLKSPEEFKSYQEKERSKLNELRNGLNESPKGIPMFKFFKTEKKEVSASEIDKDTMIELKNDKGETSQITIAEMVNAVAKKNADESAKKKAEDEEKANAEQEIDVCGEKMPLKELINRYQKMAAKKNDDDMSDDDKKKKADEEKKNAEEAEEKKKKDEEEKTNALKVAAEKAAEAKKNFEELQNAHKKGMSEPARVIETSTDMTARGKQRYGSAS